MEQAFVVENISQLEKSFSKEFSRLYFGAETCETKIPSVKDVEKAKSFCEENNLDFSFLTPFSTDQGLVKLKQTFSVLSKNDEVVVNDFGVLKEAADSKLMPVVGRLLNKQFRDPRIKDFKGIKELSEHLSFSQASVPGFRKILKDFGVKRIELDNLSQGIGTNLSGTGFFASVYYPLVFVSTTRFCLTANCSKLANSKKVGIFSCSKECLDFRFRFTSKELSEDILLIGNSLFFENAVLPNEKELLAKGIDRLVTNKALLQ